MLSPSEPYYQVKWWPKGQWAAEESHYFSTEEEARNFAHDRAFRGHHYLITKIQDIAANFV
jgi:hypothetical protein